MRRKAVVTMLWLVEGCAASGAGRPAWVADPLVGIVDDGAVVFAAVGTSDLVRADPSLGRAAAEADARSQIAAQLRATVRRVVSRTSEAMRDHATGAVLGQTVVADASEELTELVLVGSRPAHVHWSPDPEHPERVWVRIVVTVEPAMLAKSIADAGEREALRHQMRLRHDALLRSLRESLRIEPPPG